MRLYVYLTIISAVLVTGCSTAPEQPQDADSAFQLQVDSFLNAYNKRFQELKIPSAEAQWKLNTYIVEGDTVTSQIAQEAEEAMVAFTGSAGNIEMAQRFLKRKEELSPVQLRQLNSILYAAAGSPQIIADLVKEKIKAENAQTTTLYGFDFTIDKVSVSANHIDEILEKSVDLNERLKAWEASKEVGVSLKEGLVNLQRLRNETVKALDYSDYFQYQVSDYGMTSDEMIKACRGLIKDIWPLYRELHTWARYELARKYNEEVPDMLPAHWLPNRWGQEWSAMISSEGVDLDAALSEKSAEWIMTQGEDFYVSLGYPELPESFYTKSSLYPLPADAAYKKNNHASAWHIDNAADVRSLMSIVPNTRWWGTTLHELGHIYYYMMYSNDSVPIILRGGANRAYHEAMGTLIGLASMQPPFLKQYGLISDSVEVDNIQQMLKEALDYVVLLPWGAGVMTEFEHDLYANSLPDSQFNSRWWELKYNLQGIVPPNERDERYCDAASKTHINNDAAQYYDYALSNVLLFQFHDHIARNILGQDPHNTNYYGSKETGAFLKNLMKDGANCDWREHLQQHLGAEMSAKAMVNYFNPLMDWLKKENENRTCSLPEVPQF
ncbi:MAG: M2 family metallopeptidase [Bacteroidia bacterium]|nr:M2 family metallopeptidase [Bacteroidia bacterium]